MRPNLQTLNLRRRRWLIDLAKWRGVGMRTKLFSRADAIHVYNRYRWARSLDSGPRR